MRINNFKKMDKGSLVAKFDIEFEEWGFTIRECMIMNGKNGQWLSLPSRQYEADGQKKYYDLVVFTKEKKQQLTDHVLARLKHELNSEATF